MSLFRVDLRKVREMRTGSALAPEVVAARGTPTFWGRRGDVVAVVVLVALPMLIYGLPALVGHAVLPGDDLTQNLPLRMLAGQQIRAGHLPLFNPYIWSGAPLLAGWNAAAAYPLTWLFAILPGTAAWTVNMIITWAVAGLGMFCFLRALRLASLASFLGAFSFAFAGGMSAQVTHFGLVAGLSWVPLGLLGILRLSQDRPLVSRLGWTAVLATVVGLVILAGEPRAIDDADVILLIYAAWQIARLGRRGGPALVSVAAGLALGAALGAVQWLPGPDLLSGEHAQREVLAQVVTGENGVAEQRGDAEDEDRKRDEQDDRRDVAAAPPRRRDARLSDHPARHQPRPSRHRVHFRNST